MSTSDHIFLRTDASPAEVAEALARGLAADNEGGDAEVFLRRQLPDGTDVGLFVTRNEYRTPADPEPDEITVLDGYDIAVEVRVVPRDEETLRSTSRQIFEEIAEKLDWPALLVLQLDLLLAAHRPGEPVTWFPEGTTPDGDDARIWAPFVV